MLFLVLAVNAEGFSFSLGNLVSRNQKQKPEGHPCLAHGNRDGDHTCLPLSSSRLHYIITKYPAAPLSFPPSLPSCEAKSRYWEAVASTTVLSKRDDAPSPPAPGNAAGPAPASWHQDRACWQAAGLSREIRSGAVFGAAPLPKDGHALGPLHYGEANASHWWRTSGRNDQLQQASWQTASDYQGQGSLNIIRI